MTDTTHTPSERDVLQQWAEWHYRRFGEVPGTGAPIRETDDILCGTADPITAAAPDLLAALDGWLAHFDIHAPGNHRAFDAFTEDATKARAAIAKARGEAA